MSERSEAAGRRGLDTPAAYCHPVDQLAHWQAETFARQVLGRAAGEAPRPRRLTDFQEGIVEARRRLAAQGLPPGRL
jgi:hypothetical protein